MFIEGSVKRGEKSGWAFTVRCRGETVDEGSGAVEVTTSSMVTESKAVTKALAAEIIHRNTCSKNHTPGLSLSPTS